MLSRIVARGPWPFPGARPFPPPPLSVAAGDTPAGDDRALTHCRDRGTRNSPTTHSARPPAAFRAQVGAPQLPQPKGTSWRFRKARVGAAPESASARIYKRSSPRRSSVVSSQQSSDQEVTDVFRRDGTAD